MSRCLIIVGATSYVLKGFEPTEKYDGILLSKRSELSENPKFSTNELSIKYFNYDLTDGEFNMNNIWNAAEEYDQLDIIYAAYSPFGLDEDSSLDKISTGLMANCAQPLYFLSNLSRLAQSKKINTVFISSIYARVSPNPRNYKVDSEINPLYYGVAKAGVEQGIRWLSTANKNHIFNAISLGPLPKKKVQEKSPALIHSLIESMPSGKLVEHKELHATINFLLSQASESVRGSTIYLDGGYSIL